MEISREVKKELRGRIRECRKKVSREEKESWDALLCEQFITLLEEASFSVSSVYLYLDFRDKVTITYLLSRDVNYSYYNLLGKNILHDH